MAKFGLGVIKNENGTIQYICAASYHPAIV